MKVFLYLLCVMIPILFHIYGPFSIHSYGLAIIVGIAFFIIFATRNPLRIKYIPYDVFMQLLNYGIIVGIIGGRTLHVLTEPEAYTSCLDSLKIWEGGFSILGTVIALAAFVPWYLHRHKIPLLPILDLITLYAPLVQAISRIGCFCAGCCYGATSSLPWAITYTHPESMAPLCTALHPTQLYSAGVLFIIFLVFRYRVFPRLKKPGTILSLYLIAIGLERFMVDWWRADRVFSTASTLFSIHQLIALGIMSCGILLYHIISRNSA